MAMIGSLQWQCKGGGAMQELPDTGNRGNARVAGYRQQLRQSPNSVSSHYILYYIILFYFTLYCIILYYILYHTTIYYIILCYVMFLFILYYLHPLKYIPLIVLYVLLRDVPF